MSTIFVTLSLFLVIFSSNHLYADKAECLDITKQSICYDIDGTEDVVKLELKKSKTAKSSMLVSEDLAQTGVEDLMVVSSELIQMEEDMEPSVYDAFTKADELYYRFAYKILDRNNRDTTVVITTD